MAKTLKRVFGAGEFDSITRVWVVEDEYEVEIEATEDLAMGETISRTGPYTYRRTQDGEIPIARVIRGGRQGEIIRIITREAPIRWA